MGEAAHLARRFFGSLLPVGPRTADSAWAEEQLQPAERALWQRLTRVDRRHAVGVARRVEQNLRDEASRSVLAAALLHDIGKVAAGLDTFGRVAATLSIKAAGFRRASAWSGGRRFTRRVGLYAQHPGIGADLLERAGSDPLIVAWTREHHLPPERWTVPLRIGEVLKSADDD